MTPPSSRSHVAMSNINFPEPYLPLELERLIFELALTQNGIRRTSTSLSLVAKRVCEWLRPLVFRVIACTWRTSSSKLPQSIAPFVQHLIIDGYYVKGILSSCPNIINLTIHGYYTDLNLQEMTHLTRLGVDSSYIQPHNELPIQPYFNLTHLNVHGANPDSSWREWEFLAHLPKLTHINTDEAIQNHISKVLRLCPLLKILVVEFFKSHRSLHYLHACYQVDDNRLVLTVWKSYSGHIRDWERGAHGLVDLWIISERIVFARSRNYFARPLPKLIPRDLEWEEYLNEDGKKWFHEL